MIFRNKLLKLLLIINLPLSAVFAQDTVSTQVGRTASEAIQFGEDLTFKVRYGFIKAGIAHMRVVDLVNMDEQPQIHIQTTAQSVPAFNWIFKVDDVVNVYVDPVKMTPYYFEKKLREGTYKADLRVHYGISDSVARVEFVRYKEDMSIRKHKEYPVKIPANVFDILSAFYFIRTQPLEVGKSVYLSSHEKKKIYDLEVKVHRKETIKVDAGKFRCLVVEPVLQGEGIFKQKGRLLIWLTDDALKIPVQMTSKVTVGHITTELTHIKRMEEKIPARLK